MTEWLFDFALLAQQQQQQAKPAGSIFPLLLPVFLVVMYILIVHRPMKREREKQKSMTENLKKNDHVLTIGGIYGVVMSVRREVNEVTLKIDEQTNTKIRVTLDSIRKVISDPAASEESPAAASAAGE